MSERIPRNRLLRRQIQQLILLRETGPKSAAWHDARTRLIWRLHNELHEAEPAPGEAERMLEDLPPRHQDTKI